MPPVGQEPPLRRRSGSVRRPRYWQTDGIPPPAGVPYNQWILQFHGMTQAEWNAVLRQMWERDQSLKPPIKKKK